MGSNSGTIDLVDSSSRQLVAYRPPRSDTAATTAVDVVVGVSAAGITAAVVATRTARRVAKPFVDVVLRPPMVPIGLQPGSWLAGLARHGAAQRQLARNELSRLLDALLPAVLAEVLSRVDLTSLVKKHVDVEAIVADVDLNAIAARLDIEGIVADVDLAAIIGRLDLAGLAEQVISEIDLPEIIRESTGSVASETLRGARMRGIAADEAISRAVDRVFSRRRPPAPEAPVPDAPVPGPGKQS